MTSASDFKELRQALEAPIGFDRTKHAKRTEDVRASFPHTVQFRELIEGSTCLTEALGLYKDGTYRAIAGGYFDWKIFAGKQFVTWLLANDRLEELARPASGCLVLYFADGEWKHAVLKYPV
jgi:hypothetical protein